MNKNELHKYVISVAEQSPCKKRKVGAVIAHFMNGKYTVEGEGFNYNPNGECEVNGETHPDTIHAEISCLNSYLSVNAIRAIRVATKMYVTHSPCANCQAHLEAANMPFEVVGEFMKFDSGKPRMALVPPSLAISVAEVLTYGAKKYKPDNWRKTPTIEGYISALERHFNAWKAGEEFDPESGLHHLKHVACNIAFLLELKDLPKIDYEK